MQISTIFLSAFLTAVVTAIPVPYRRDLGSRAPQDKTIGENSEAAVNAFTDTVAGAAKFLSHATGVTIDATGNIINAAVQGAKDGHDSSFQFGQDHGEDIFTGVGAGVGTFFAPGVGTFAGAVGGSASGKVLGPEAIATLGGVAGAITGAGGTAIKQIIDQAGSIKNKIVNALQENSSEKKEN